MKEIFFNLCTEPELDKPSRMKSEIITLVNVKKGKQFFCGWLDTLDDEVSWNKLCVDFIVTQKYLAKERRKTYY